MGDRPGSTSRCTRVRTKCWTDYVLKKLPDVSGSGLVEAGRYKMVSEPTLAVSRARVSQLRRHGVHAWCVPGVVAQHGTCAGTGCTDVAKMGRS